VSFILLAAKQTLMSLAECYLLSDNLIVIGRILASEFAMPPMNSEGTRRHPSPLPWYCYFRCVSKELTAMLMDYIPECRPANDPPWLSRFNLTTFYLSMAAHTILVAPPRTLGPFQEAVLIKIRDDRATWKETGLLVMTTYRREGWTTLLLMLHRALEILGLKNMVTVLTMDCRRALGQYAGIKTWIPSRSLRQVHFNGLTMSRKGRTDTLPLIFGDGNWAFKHEEHIFSSLGARGCLILAERGSGAHGVPIHRAESDPLLVCRTTFPGKE
jgi:hypothetical protein